MITTLSCTTGQYSAKAVLDSHKFSINFLPYLMFKINYGNSS